MITDRIAKREKEKAELEAQLAIEMKRLVILTEPQIKAFLKKLQASDMNDINDRRGLINIFVREIYLKNDRFTMILNGSGQPVEVTDLLLDDLEAAFGDDTIDTGKSSSLVADAPPLKNPGSPVLPGFFYVLCFLAIGAPSGIFWGYLSPKGPKFGRLSRRLGLFCGLFFGIV